MERRARHAAYARAQGRTDLAEVLEAELAAESRCIRCGRKLTDEVSIRRTIGPECWSREPHAEVG
jgi:hypothetical protein